MGLLHLNFNDLSLGHRQGHSFRFLLSWRQSPDIIHPEIVGTFDVNILARLFLQPLG